MFVRMLALGLAYSAFAAVPAADPPPELLAAPHPKGYVCYRARTPITIDGKHDDVWNDAPWSEEFTDIEGDRKPKPRHKTRMKMLHDDDALYIFAELEDPHVWGTLKDHDSIIFHDNDFEVFLDTNGDNHAYGELEVNAMNTTWDLLLTKPYKDGGVAVTGWEIKGLQTAVNVNGTLNNPGDTDHGWTLEIRWPYASLRELSKLKSPPADGEQWRINFSRVQWKHKVMNGKYVKDGKVEDNWVWSPQGVIDMHRPERWGYLQFSTAKPGRAEFEKDADWPAKDLLHRVYYAQRLHKVEHKSFSANLDNLKLEGALVPLVGTVQLEATKNGYEATLEAPARGARKARKATRYSITQDGQLRGPE